MVTLFKAIFSGVSVALLYILVILIAPFIIRFSGNTNFSSQPEWINAKLYSIEVNGNEFNSQATAMGFVLSILIGIVLYFIINRLSTNRQGKNHRVT